MQGRRETGQHPFAGLLPTPHAMRGLRETGRNRVAGRLAKLPKLLDDYHNMPIVGWRPAMTMGMTDNNHGRL